MSKNYVLTVCARCPQQVRKYHGTKVFDTGLCRDCRFVLPREEQELWAA